MTIERHEPEGVGRALRDADGPVPGTGHAHAVLVADAHAPRLAVELHEGGELAWRSAVGVGGEALDQLLGADVGLPDPRPVGTVEERARAPFLPLYVLSGGELRGERRRTISLRVARFLGAVHRHRPPDVTPGRQTDAERPPCGGGHPASKRQATRHRRSHTRVAPRPYCPRHST